MPDGALLWTATTGAGSPVVCCHGGPGLWDYLRDVALLLEDSHRVIRFDQRGGGRSTGDEGPFTLARAVDDLEQLREALGLHSWAVLGHSWGAELALRYAAAHPQRTSAVVYLGGIGAGNAWREPYLAERNDRLGADLPRWQELSDRPRSTREEREWCLLQWSPDFSPAGSPRAYAAALWGTRPQHAVVNWRANTELMSDSATNDLREAAQHVSAPVLLLHGRDDPRPWTATDGLLAALPRARRIVLHEAGHAPWVERPEAVRAAILEALADL